MTSDEYLDLLRDRLAGSYNVEERPRLGSFPCPLYARSHVVAGKYILHRSITYEKMELNEHVLCRVLADPVTESDVALFVQDLKDLVAELVKPSDEHMSSAFTGVLVAEDGFDSGAAGKLTKSGFTRHFWFGLRGWCFLRLLGVDLSTGQTWANRRGKEVQKAYQPG